MAKKLPHSAIRLDGEIAYVHLYNADGLEAVIDAIDVPLVEGMRWRALKCKSHVYAYTTLPTTKGNYSHKGLHTLLMSNKPGFVVDHIDHNCLNNKRDNLRVASISQNNANKIVSRNNKLGMKGVYFTGTRFAACITKNGKSFSIGQFESAAEASAAYYGAARALYGDFAFR